MTSGDAARRLRLFKQNLETESFFGTEEIPRGTAPKPGRRVPGGTEADKAWEKLVREASACTLCRLSKGRNTVVVGEGSRTADLMFIGEGPGHEEDKQGRPFVGRAGQLLTKIIEAMGLKRGDVYIANCVKCRPPQNRNPEPDEIAACRPYLKRQIELVRPKIICALGKFAAQTLLQTEIPISRLRGRFHDYEGVKLMPTYHPAYLLRNPGEKRTVWEDMQKVMKELGLKARK